MEQIEKTMNLAKIFLGEEIEEPQEEALKALCGEALSWWKSRLRDDITQADCGEALALAAAWRALAGFVQGSAPAPLSFRAGDISVSAGAGQQERSPRALLDLGEQVMQNFVTDKDFSFRGVRG